jgi:hypothetical protein
MRGSSIISHCRSLALFIIVVLCYIKESSSRPGAHEDIDCVSCVSKADSMYIKRLWFPLAPAEYTCLNCSDVLSVNNIIVEVVCNPVDCIGIKNRYPSKIFHPSNVSCCSVGSGFEFVQIEDDYESGEEGVWSEGLGFCTDIGETIAIVVIFCILILRVGTSIRSFIKSMYSRIVVV